MKRLLFAAFALVAFGAGTAQAEGAGRSGTADGIDSQDTTPSLTPRPAISEVVSASVDYDEAGTVHAGRDVQQVASPGG